MTTRNGYENLIYEQIGKTVVDTVAGVVGVFRSIVRNNNSAVQSIAFSSITFDSSSNGEFFSSPFFQGASFERIAEYATPIISDIISNNTPRHRSVPIIEEIEDVPTVQTHKKKSMEDVQIRKKTPKPMPKILNVPDINAMKDVISRTSKPTKPKKVETKDIVVDVPEKNVKSERARPTGRLYDDVPEGVHIDEKFAKDLATLSGGTSMMKTVMPALGVCVSKLKKINF